MKTSRLYLIYAIFLGVCPSLAWSVEGGVVVMKGLDKVSARISQFQATIHSTVTFGTFSITPRMCDKRPPEEMPEISVFLEIADTPPGQLSRQIFSGWMFASSPGLSAVSHPVYDVWVLDCLPSVAAQSVQ